ncbi:glutamine synthetase family protein [Liquorilactobacillus mali]|uniref:Glutamine synthetase n=1 Tax=Liquorilactobacillus mali TaxID=1618 RepID=A0A0R2FGN8_9LACO|nr:glutamine synthetase family protein [Liquorilactobacillus mali]KRN27791.1 glutamine synthetase [Liquorilactobacillus mali]MDN7145515.1 glutamine synthetase family protein [Liquorilactobacillus mali]
MLEENIKNIIDRLDEQGIELLEFIYVDYTGIPRGKTMFLSEVGNHLSAGMGITKAMPASTMRDEIVSVAGMNAVGEYRLVPDLKSLRILPYAPTVATMMCDYRDQDNQKMEFDPRVSLQAIVAEYKKLGFEIKMTYESEFTLYQRKPDNSLEPYNPKICFAAEAMDNSYHFLPKLIKNLREIGISPVEYYPEAGAGQHELPIAPTDPLTAGDNEIRLKRVIKEFFAATELYATFAPKPNLNSASNGAHIHMSLWKDGTNVLYDKEDQLELSQVGYYFVAGLLRHINALLALTCPTVNSYQRLQPGHWSSAYATFGKDNREAAIRIPSTFRGDRASSMNIELKASDATANPYMALAGILSAGLDGIKNKSTPLTPIDVVPETLTEGEREEKKISRLPQSLSEALAALKEDSVMLKTFSNVGIETYAKVKESDIAYFEGKTAAEIAAAHRDIY